MTPQLQNVSIRRAAEADRPALVLLARLDSADPLEGDVLIAHVEGEPRAAMQIDTGASVADPFQRTAEIVELLRLRAASLRDTPRRPRKPLTRMWRRAEALELPRT